VTRQQKGLATEYESHQPDRGRPTDTKNGQVNLIRIRPTHLLGTNLVALYRVVSHKATKVALSIPTYLNQYKGHSMDNYSGIKTDFSNIDEIISDDNHPVRRLYRSYLNGDYTDRAYDKWNLEWSWISEDKKKSTFHRQARRFVISSFVEYNSTDYELSHGQVQRWLVKNIDADKLEKLNDVLIKDVIELMEDREVTA